MIGSEAIVRDAEKDSNADSSSSTSVGTCFRGELQDIPVWLEGSNKTMGNDFLRSTNPSLDGYQGVIL